jgi:hypothetical protein
MELLPAARQIASLLIRQQPSEAFSEMYRAAAVIPHSAEFTFGAHYDTGTPSLKSRKHLP